MKRSDFFESLRLRLPAMPRIQPAGGAPLQFAASGGGGGGGYDDPDDDYYDEYDDEPIEPRRGDEERQPTAARRRTVQSEPDDRYWTDYLRIALPVIGLLLVIAVFWFWAQQLIDDPDDDVTPTEPPGIAEVIDEPTETPDEGEPDEQEVVATPPDEQQDQQQQEQDQQGQQTQPEPTQAPVVTPTQEPQDQQPDEQVVADDTDNQIPDDGGQQQTDDTAQQDEAPDGIAPDMEVSVTDGPLNMRSEPSTAGDIVTELSAGDALSVVSGPESGDDYTWWEVTDQTGNIGWVAEDFIEPAD